jgi:hypothetical protein
VMGRCWCATLRLSIETLNPKYKKM